MDQRGQSVQGRGQRVGGAYESGPMGRGGGARRGSSGMQRETAGGRALMAFPERKRGKVPGRDKVEGGLGRGAGRTPGFVRLSGATSCLTGAPGVRPRPAPRSPCLGSSSRLCFPQGPEGTRANQRLRKTGGSRQSGRCREQRSQGEKERIKEREKWRDTETDRQTVTKSLVREE